MSRLYQSAGSIVHEVLFNNKSLKSSCSKRKVGTADYALACETIKYGSIITQLLEMSELSMSSLDISNKGILFAMIFELLFGKGRIQGGGAIKRIVSANLDKLRDSLQRLMASKNVIKHEDLLPTSVRIHSNLPRYVRINEIKADINQGLQDLRNSISKDLNFDEHIPSLVKLPHNQVGLGDNPFVKNGQWIIQDKASCFPSQILMDEWQSTGGDIIDCCAAPGNKTSHMAAILYRSQISNPSDTGHNRIFAFDKSVRRAELLQRRMDEAGATSVTVSNEDFLQLDTSSKLYSNVRSILVDPSCSGSGVIRSLDRAVEIAEDDSSNDSSRLKQLQEFQISIVLKAMSFPSVQTVVYSTCSIYEEENECVVGKVLESLGKDTWDVKAPYRMTSWPRRGQRHDGLTSQQSEALIRCQPSDGMNGFFVALFVKSAVSSHVDKQTSRSKSNLKRNVVDDSLSEKQSRQKIRYIDDVRFPDDRRLRSRITELWRPLANGRYF